MMNNTTVIRRGLIVVSPAMIVSDMISNCNVIVINDMIIDISFPRCSNLVDKTDTHRPLGFASGE